MSAITCVQLTCTCPRRKPELDVGRSIERALSLQIHDIAPRRISARPRVATALTRGSRPASGGPKRTPYASVTIPPNAINREDATASGTPLELMSDQAMNAPIAPTAQEPRFSTPVDRYRSGIPTPESAEI